MGASRPARRRDASEILRRQRARQPDFGVALGAQIVVPLLRPVVSRRRVGDAGQNLNAAVDFLVRV